MLGLGDVGIGRRDGCTHPANVHSRLVNGSCSSCIPTKVNQPPLIPPTAAQNLKQPCDTVSKVTVRTATQSAVLLTYGDTVSRWVSCPGTVERCEERRQLTYSGGYELSEHVWRGDL